MDRLRRIVMQGGLAVMIGSTVSSLGCRSMKSEIPPAKAVSTTGAPTPEVGFSSAPRPDATGAAGLYGGIQQASGDSAGGLPGGVQQAGMPGGAAGGQPQYGTPVGNRNNYTEVLPSTGRYGPPGTTALPPTQQTAPAAATPTNEDLPSTLPPSTNPLQGAIGVDLPSP